MYKQTVKDAQLIADAALERIRQDGVPANPENYTVWYNYYSGEHPDLVRAINVLVSNRQSIGEERCAELYRQYFGQDAEVQSVQDTGRKLHEMLQTVLGAMQAAGADVDRYSHTLTAISGGLDIARTVEQMKALIATVATETAQMAAKNRALQSQLSTSTSTIEAMRKDLDSVRKEAMTDALTGIANRKQFDTALRQAATDAVEYGKPMTLLLMDIDHFKRFNDTHGHLAGDQVLKLVGRTLTESVKGRDTPARYGGEEFGIIMPETRLADALTVAEQIRKSIAGRKIVKRTTGESIGNITMSIGVALYRPGEPLTTLIQRADAALYAAKSAGRNQVLADRQDEAEAA